jgi:hypothetical protein
MREQILNHYQLRRIVHFHDEPADVVPDIEDQHAADLIGIGEIQTDICEILPYCFACDGEPCREFILRLCMPFRELANPALTKYRQTSGSHIAYLNANEKVPEMRTLRGRPVRRHLPNDHSNNGGTGYVSPESVA